MAQIRHEKNPLDERNKNWYRYCAKSMVDFNESVRYIESTPTTYYNADKLKEAIALMRYTHILDQGTLFYKAIKRKFSVF